MGLYEAYIDFDNTITEFDVLDDLIKRYATDSSWIDAEAEWEAGIIGSKACLERQIGTVRITEPLLMEYLATIQIDPFFQTLLRLFETFRIPVLLVSDSFRPLIEVILKNHGVTGVPIRANEWVLSGDRPAISFPYFNSICSTAGNCKCSHLMNRQRPDKTKKIYIGDGRSDICPALACEIVFAKASLLKYLTKEGTKCIPFETLADVHAQLSSIFHES